MGNVDAAELLAHGGMRLRIKPASALEAQRGDSIAVNGVCLTLVELDGVLAFDVVPETLERSNLGDLHAGDTVNLETSLRAGDAIGGHLVYGHVDARAIVLARHAEGAGCRVICTTPPTLEPLIAEKGSVALDGVSLTVAAVGQGEFEVALIPETLEKTTLGRKEAGSVLNVEADPIARYVAHMLGLTQR